MAQRMVRQQISAALAALLPGVFLSVCSHQTQDTTSQQPHSEGVWIT